MLRIIVSILFFPIALLCVTSLGAYQTTSSETPPLVTSPLPDAVIKQMEFRNVGPFRGGRSAAVEGVRGDTTRF